MTHSGHRPPVVILCGGRGTRLRERTESVPKALVEIGGRPILWHVVQIYAAQGFQRFLLVTGCLGEAVAEFAPAERWPGGVEVECVDTGLETPTGGRIAQLAERVQGGTSELEGDRVAGFVEKPRSEHWINGGFLCLEPGALDYLDRDSALEREPLQRLAAAGQLRAFRHEGFRDCMDTYEDAVVLNDRWRTGDAPWRVWDAAPAGSR